MDLKLSAKNINRQKRQCYAVRQAVCAKLIAAKNIIGLHGARSGPPGAPCPRTGSSIFFR